MIRLDGPMIELVGRDFKGIFRHHVNFAQASLTPQKNGKVELYVDDGGGLDRPFLQEKISGVWGLWRFQLPPEEERRWSTSSARPNGGASRLRPCHTVEHA